MLKVFNFPTEISWLRTSKFITLSCYFRNIWVMFSKISHTSIPSHFLLSWKMIPVPIFHAHKKMKKINLVSKSDTTIIQHSISSHAFLWFIGSKEIPKCSSSSSSYWFVGNCEHMVYPSNFGILQSTIADFWKASKLLEMERTSNTFCMSSEDFHSFNKHSVGVI